VLESHCHTLHSPDGHITPGALRLACRRSGVDAVAITDHDTIAGALEFQRIFARQPGPRILVGEELTLADGSHVIGLLLREALSARTLPEALDEIRAQGGLAVVPHPLRARDGAWARQPAAAELCPDAVEIFNPKCGREMNLHVRGLLPAAVRPWAGSDAHYAGDVGQARVVIAGADGTAEQHVRALFRGERTYRLLGAKQVPGAGGRQYLDHSPWARRLAPVPAWVRPFAWQAYAAFRNYWPQPRLDLESKYGG